MVVDAAVEVSWIAVVVGTVGYQALGAVWYGPLFGDRWMAGMGYDGRDDGPAGEDATAGYLVTTVGSLVAVLAVALLADWAGASTPVDGLILGVVVGVGFVATSALQAVPFEGRAWSVYLLNVGYNVVALAGVGVLAVVV